MPINTDFEFITPQFVDFLNCQTFDRNDNADKIFGWCLYSLNRWLIWILFTFSI